MNGADSAKTVDDLKNSMVFKAEWREEKIANRNYVFAIRQTGMGESYIDLHGWIYNQSYKEWRRIFTVKTRGLGDAKLSIDTETRIISLRGMAINKFNDVEVFRFDLRATSDDPVE